ncbi:MAG: ATP-binding cassette domain-containing protein [Anaerolineaceae bacterium]|nr:ATP-binding cassette domain-containing protein [Anaerolineaceae bacterium]
MGGGDGMRRLMDKDIVKPKSVSATLARFWPYFRQRWYALIVVLILMFAVTWTQIMTPKLLGQAVDCYIVTQNPFASLMQSSGDNNQSSELSNCWFDTTDYSKMPADQAKDARIAGLLRLVGLLVALFVGGSFMSGIMFYFMAWAGQHALREIRVGVFKHVHKLSLGYYSEHEAGDIMSRFTNDSETIQQVLSFALVNVLSSILLIIWVVITMIQTNAPFALLSLAVVPFMAIATVYFSGQARKAFRKSREEMGSVNANLQESIAGVREVQAFNREEENIEEFKRTNAANRDANVRAAAFTSALNPILEALGYAALAIVVVVGGLSLLRNEPLLGTAVISIGTIIAFLSYVQQFNRPIQQIAVLWANIQSAIAGGERIFSLMDEVPNVVDKPDAKVLPQIQGKVEFDNAFAEYKSGVPVLRGVSLTAEPGETVAIVGPTGAGKTTIMNLLPRFYDVTKGSVKIDGNDVRDVTAASLRSQIGIVLQDTFLFSDTVMNNIRYGKLDATDEEVIAAATLVAANSFIERLPQGYQTILGERGSGLSQGQRQLIAIARVALMSPRILILDEATSSVDTRTERLIQKAFEGLLKGRTSFVIAHRLSTIRNANQVLVLKDGEIIERGTHNSLLEKKGAYYDLYMSQFRREDEAPSSSTGSAPTSLKPITGTTGD